jgi:uncharacterized protein YneF (UPF0154 family)
MLMLIFRLLFLIMCCIVSVYFGFLVGVYTCYKVVKRQVKDTTKKKIVIALEKIGVRVSHL